MPDYRELAFKKIDNLRPILKEEGFEVSNPKEGQFNFQVDITNNNDSVKLLVYYSKKANKIVLQGNNEQKLYTKINDIILGAQLIVEENVELDEPEVYIGTDESGKGDYFGPLVAAAVYADKVIANKLKSIGVKDSKELTDQMISSLASKMKKMSEFVFDVIVINPAKYNLLYSKFGNLNKLLGWAHAKAIENVLATKYAPEAISDKFGNEKFIHESLQKKGKDLKLHQITKAERYTAVAAASIIARDSFNKWFLSMKKKYKYEFPKGASVSVEIKAKEILTTFGEAELEKLVKLHFKTTKKL